MPTDDREFSGGQTHFSEAANGFMPKIVKI